MSKTRTALSIFCAGLLPLLVAACSDSGGGNAAPAAPAPVALGPLTGEQICERLTAADVGAIIGYEVEAPKPSSTTTPQCSYPYKGEGNSSFNVTVAYMRVEGDLFGKSGMEGFDYVAQMQRGNPDNKETAVEAGVKATRFSGGIGLHYGLLLVGDRVMTATAFANSVKGEAVDELLKRMGTTFDN